MVIKDYVVAHLKYFAISSYYNIFSRLNFFISLKMSFDINLSLCMFSLI